MTGILVWFIGFCCLLIAHIETDTGHDTNTSTLIIIWENIITRVNVVLVSKTDMCQLSYGYLGLMIIDGYRVVGVWIG